MDLFTDFPSVPRNVDEQNRKFLLAVRDAIMAMHTSSGDMVAQITQITQIIQQSGSTTTGGGGSTTVIETFESDVDELFLIGA